MAEAQRELAQREYRASTNDSGLQAPNRAQGFRTYFDERGIHLVARSADSEPLAAVALAGVGRESDGRAQDLQAPGLAEVTPDAAQVALRWPGIHARYDNLSDGLHQAITLEQSPSGSGPLRLALEITDATLEVSENVALLRSAKRTLRLDATAAYDARGRTLPVTLTADGTRLLLAIDDQHAKYPITLKSVFNGIADAVLDSNQANADLGTSVAGAGDGNGDGFADVIVGAPYYDNGHIKKGAAFIYFGTARGRLVLASQLRGDGTSLVQPWGLSQQAGGFVGALEATSPRGRERARLQLEACPSGAPFGSVPCNLYTATTWTDLGTNPLGSTLVLPATGLSVDRVYHWQVRVQYADFRVTAPGIVAPPNPAAGPWRRLQANADVADIRTSTPPPSPVIFADGFE